MGICSSLVSPRSTSTSNADASCSSECQSWSSSRCIKLGHLGYCPICKELKWRKVGCKVHEVKGDDMWDEPDPKGQAAVKVASQIEIPVEDFQG